MTNNQQTYVWTVDNDGLAIRSNDFKHDVVLNLSGDFSTEDERVDYANGIANVLNLSSNYKRIEDSKREIEDQRDFLVEEYERAVGCGAQGYLHCAGHLFNAICNATIEAKLAKQQAAEDKRRIVELERELVTNQRVADSQRERWNINRDGDDLLVCFNDHHRSEACEYKRFASTEKADENKRIEDAVRLALNTLDAIGERTESGEMLASKYFDIVDNFITQAAEMQRIMQEGVEFWSHYAVISEMAQDEIREETEDMLEKMKNSLMNIVMENQ